MYVKYEDLKKLMDQLERDMPDVPWAPQLKKYIAAIKKMAKNLVIQENERRTT